MKVDNHVSKGNRGCEKAIGNTLYDVRMLQ